MDRQYQIPLWKKYTLTIEEASAYFGLGQKVLRRFIKEHPDESFIVYNGVQILIKRKAFEQYIDQYLTAI